MANDLINAIKTDTQPLCNMYDGRWTLEMIMAIHESNRLKKPVDMPLKNRKHPLTML